MMFASPSKCCIQLSRLFALLTFVSISTYVLITALIPPTQPLSLANPYLEPQTQLLTSV